MAAVRVPLWAVCVLRVALATVYFQEEFLDGGDGGGVSSPLSRCSADAPSRLWRRRGMGEELQGNGARPGG